MSGHVLPGCKFTLGIELGADDGGHKHYADRPLSLIANDPLFPVGTELQTDANGEFYALYSAPIVSGDVKFSIKGGESFGLRIEDAPPIEFKVGIKDLVPLSGDSYTFKCAIDPGNAACVSSSYLHENFYYVTPDVNARMSAIGTAYKKEVPEDEDPLIITDASLARGGFYDFKAYQAASNAWKKGHYYHRQGTDIDVNRPTIDSEEEFESAVCRNGGFPDPEDDNHYHLYFDIYGYYKKYADMCPVEVGPQ